MFEVTVTDHFVAQHQLRLADGALEPLHEHAWRVTVTVSGTRLPANGMLVDFHVLRRQLADCLGGFERQNLNRHAAFAGRNPSAENVAVHVAQHVSAGLPARVRLAGVEVEEEQGCVARYRPAARRAGPRGRRK